jgi:hypothetical protein
MTFTPGVPFDGQSLDNSRPLVRNNFTSIYDNIDENHYPPNDANDGKHKKAVFLNDSSTTGTAANEVAIFPQTYNASLQLMYRPPSTASAADMWPACPMIRAYGRFNSNTNSTIGTPLNLSFTKVSATETTVTITTPFPIGAATDNYIPFVFVQRNLTAGEFVEPKISNLTAAGFTITVLGSSNNPVMICVMILGS